MLPKAIQIQAAARRRLKKNARGAAFFLPADRRDDPTGPPCRARGKSMQTYCLPSGEEALRLSKNPRASDQAPRCACGISKRRQQRQGARPLRSCSFRYAGTDSSGHRTAGRRQSTYAYVRGRFPRKTSGAPSPARRWWQTGRPATGGRGARALRHTSPKNRRR